MASCWLAGLLACSAVALHCQNVAVGGWAASSTRTPRLAHSVKRCRPADGGAHHNRSGADGRDCCLGCCRGFPNTELGQLHQFVQHDPCQRDPAARPPCAIYTRWAREGPMQPTSVVQYMHNTVFHILAILCAHGQPGQPAPQQAEVVVLMHAGTLTIRSQSESRLIGTLLDLDFRPGVFRQMQGSARIVFNQITFINECEGQVRGAYSHTAATAPYLIGLTAAGWAWGLKHQFAPSMCTAAAWLGQCCPAVRHP
jgi:hypothetical protein